MIQRKRDLFAPQLQLRRWRRVIRWEPRDSDGEAAWDQAAAFEQALDAIRSLPRDGAARLLTSLAESFFRQGAESTQEYKRKRGHPARTPAEMADLLCAIETAKGETKKEKREAAAKKLGLNINDEAISKAARYARKALKLGNK
jgi:hypothetical protein